MMTRAAFDDFNAALRTVNDSCYGLQVGPFARDIRWIQRAWHKPGGSAASSTQMLEATQGTTVNRGEIATCDSMVSEGTDV